MTLDRYATLLQRQRDLRTQIAQRIGRRNGHVAFFRTNAITEVRTGKLVRVAPAVPVTFVGVDRVTGGVLLVVKLGGIEHEELGFRTEESRVCQAGKFQVTLGALCNRAWIVGVT